MEALSQRQGRQKASQEQVCLAYLMFLQFPFPQQFNKKAKKKKNLKGWFIKEKENQEKKTSKVFKYFPLF